MLILVLLLPIICTRHKATCMVKILIKTTTLKIYKRLYNKITVNNMSQEQWIKNNLLYLIYKNNIMLLAWRSRLQKIKMPNNKERKILRKSKSKLQKAKLKAMRRTRKPWDASLKSKSKERGKKPKPRRKWKSKCK